MSKVYKYLLFTALGVLCSVGAYAQTESAHNSYSPYSVFGIGDLYTQGSAYNKSMGGVGIAMRNNQYINYLNPAAVTARDTLAFMADINLSVQNKFYSQNGKKSANNTFNISGLAFTVPIYNKSAFIMGITPFSDVGFDFTTKINSGSLAETGYITRAAKGDGGLYQLFAGAGIQLGSHFSVGAQAMYYFGKIDKDYVYTFQTSSANSLYTGYDLELNALTGKIGLQYETRLSNGLTITAGATHRLKTSLKGRIRDYKLSSLSSQTDTLKYSLDTLGKNNGGVKLAGETGIGIAIRRGDKWRFEIDYTFADWSNSGFESISGISSTSNAAAFSCTKAQSLRAGFEYIPNKNDIRYYLRRCAYRAGLYYDKAYYKFNGNAVNSYGLTFGVTLPIFRWYNGLTLGVDIGQRGKNTANMVRERYVMFSVGFNIHDIWFQKARYE
ncbi:MAG: hypothetical protein IJ151_06010 [Bacteroidales bacterium]|nr:hypothetical protein [Bacteroidales bacterium]